jgi:hypothetical protein
MPKITKSAHLNSSANVNLTLVFEVDIIFGMIDEAIVMEFPKGNAWNAWASFK